MRNTKKDVDLKPEMEAKVRENLGKSEKISDKYTNVIYDAI